MDCGAGGNRFGSSGLEMPSDMPVRHPSGAGSSGLDSAPEHQSAHKCDRGPEAGDIAGGKGKGAGCTCHRGPGRLSQRGTQRTQSGCLLEAKRLEAKRLAEAKSCVGGRQK